MKINVNPDLGWIKKNSKIVLSIVLFLLTLSARDILRQFDSESACFIDQKETINMKLPLTNPRVGKPGRHC